VWVVSTLDLEGVLFARRGKYELERMGKKLYVGGLAWATRDEGLRQAFERFGEVIDARVITDRDTGRSRGFGFVTFAEESDAINAMSQMSGAELDGRRIKVDIAQERRPREGRGGGYGGSRGRW